MSSAEVHLAMTHQRCPRRRMLEFNILGSGIEPVYLDVVETTRRHVRHGISYVLGGGEPAEAIRIIQTRLADLYSTRGIDPNVWPDPYRVFTEQRALVQAVMLGFAAHPLYDMLTRWTVMDINHICQTATGEVYSYVIRPVAVADRDTMVRDVHSLYTIAQGAADREKYGDKYGGLFLQYVVLGDRRQRSGESFISQRTPFITGYRQKVGGRMAATATRIDKRTGHPTRLGPDFKLFRVWEPTSPVTLEQWIAMLDGWGELDALFPSVLINPPEERDGKEAWAEIDRLNHIPVPAEPSAQLLDWFPMHRHSCDSPTVCPYQQLDCCYGDIPFLEPTKAGIYRQKESTDVYN